MSQDSSHDFDDAMKHVLPFDNVCHRPSRWNMEYVTAVGQSVDTCHFVGAA